MDAERKEVLFVDAGSADALLEPVERVVLLGSYLGYANFGDIAQLKGVVEWYRRHTTRRPVVVLSTDSLRDELDPEQTKLDFGVDAVVYLAPDGREFAWAGLRELDTFRSVPLLHLYGGGFLNRYWGAAMLRALEVVQDEFEVEHTVLSGQQVDRSFAGELAAFLRRRPAQLVGCRDELSVQALRDHGVEAVYSFDDAWEVLGQFSARYRGLFAADGRPTTFLHLNLSAYTMSESGDSRSRVDEAIRRVGSLVSQVAAVHGSDRRLCLLQAYTDRRLLDIADTLGSVQQLEERFPFDHYEVLHLDRLMLRFDVASSAAGTPPGQDQVGGLVLSSSYHVAMLASLLGLPCRLEQVNDYYAQKGEGLDLRSILVERFLENPVATRLDRQSAARVSWLELLGTSIQDLGGFGDVREYEREERARDDCRGAGRPLSLGEYRDEVEQLQAALRWEGEQHVNWQAIAEERERSIDHLRAWIDDRESVIAQLSRRSERDGAHGGV